MTHDRRAARKKVIKHALYCGTAGSVTAFFLVLGGMPFLACAAFVAGCLAAILISHRPAGVPILVYHSVSPDATWLPWSRNTSVRPETLRTHLTALHSAGWSVISTKDLIRARQSAGPLPQKCVALHFDDAYLDNYLFAAPILREFNAPAMFFASTDFIAPGTVARDAATDEGPTAWQGYMNTEELRALDAHPLFDVEAHGTNHARVPVSDKSIGTVTADTWKHHAPLCWALEAGNKSNWFNAKTPRPPLKISGPLPENDSALAGRWWQDGRAETEAEYATRVSAMLHEAYTGLTHITQRAPKVLAWPFDRCCDVSIKAAKNAGFAAVTGGRGENRPTEDPTILSRVHVQDFAFGGGGLWLEALSIRARTNSAAGYYLWHLITAFAAQQRRRRLGRSGYESSS